MKTVFHIAMLLPIKVVLLFVFYLYSGNLNRFNRRNNLFYQKEKKIRRDADQIIRRDPHWVGTDVASQVYPGGHRTLRRIEISGTLFPFVHSDFTH